MQNTLKTNDRQLPGYTVTTVPAEWNIPRDRFVAIFLSVPLTLKNFIHLNSKAEKLHPRTHLIEVKLAAAHWKDFFFHSFISQHRSRLVKPTN